MDRNNAFIQAARVKFAELRSEYQSLIVASNAEFTNLCHNTLGKADPTPFDFLSVASVLVREAEEVVTRLDSLAVEAENQRLHEAEYFSAERDYT